MEKFKTYWRSLSAHDKITLANECMTSVQYLSKSASIGNKLGPLICAGIERHSGGEVTRKELRPDDWNLIWPELVDYES